MANGSSFDSALESLCWVIERIHAAGLKLHPEKCQFMCREVLFLGHTVGREGISTMEEKVQAMADWLTLANQKQL